MNHLVRLPAAVCAALVLCACGFTGNLRTNPGFASFGVPSTFPGTDRDFGLSLGPVPLRLATMISRPLVGDEDPWIPEVLKSVRAVRVYSYELDGASDGIREHIERTQHRLVGEGWLPVAVVRDDGSLARALVMQSPEVLRGVVVMYQEDDELVLVNVIGKIEPETLGSVMAAFDVELSDYGAPAAVLESAAAR